MALLLLLWTVAFAQEPAVGRVLVSTTPGARVVAFPRSERSIIEIGIYGTRIPVAEQLEGRSARWVLDMDAQSIGGGTTFLTFQTSREDIEVDWAVRGSDVIFSFAPGTPKVVEPGGLASVDALVARTVPREMAPPAGRALIPLSGDALTITASPAAWPLSPPAWQVSGLNGDVAAILGTTTADPWADLASYRRVLVSASSAPTEAAALYAISVGYRNLGLRREELSYLDRTLEVDGPWDRSALYLRRASALIAVRRYHEARGSCRAAWASGRTREADALVCLGLVSLATSSPPPSQTARALLAVSQVPENQLLAAELLLLDNRYDEARSVLEKLPPLLEGPMQRLAFANLGDARYALGDLEGAELAWRDAGHRGELGRVLSLRIRMVHMTQELAPTWAAEIPYLRGVSEGRGAAAAEALFLIAQIARAYDDPELAIHELAQLHDRFPELARRSDVPAQLHERCVARLEQLDRAGRQAAMVATYRDCWRPTFRELEVSTEPLESVARALVRMGLPEEALKVHVEAMALETLRGEPSQERLVALAELYLEVGRAQEALDTVNYAAKAGRADAALLALLRGQALLALGRPEAALFAWKMAEKSEDLRGEARVRQALVAVDAGDCEAGLPVLEEVLRKGWDLHRLPADRVHLARATCLASGGRVADAIAAAEEATREASDPWVAEHAATIAASAASAGGLTEIPREVGPAPEIWQRLLEEEEAASRFEEVLAERRR